MKRALELVSSVERADPEVKRIYGRLCHNFPSPGACRAGFVRRLAFSADKARKEDGRGRAHRLVLNHVAKILGADGTPLEAVAAGADAIGYMHYTRRVLSAWVYFKRFAASVLGGAHRRAR
ncbi:MAG: hypothetical protein KatS3mg074_117 [Meiothermus sp.]|nr:MAG: hypothetical protein KatS3mg074_117 [Meiothermus sp.]